MTPSSLGILGHWACGVQCQWLWPLGHHVPHHGWACFLGRVCVPVDWGHHCISVKSLALELRPARLCRLSVSASHRLCMLCSPRLVRAGSSQSPRARAGVLRPGEASPDTSQVFPVPPGSTARLGPCARCHPVPSLTRKCPVGRPCCLQSPRAPSQSRGERGRQYCDPQQEQHFVPGSPLLSECFCQPQA